MRFDLDGLEVFFPYDRMYLEQHQYMRSLKQILDAGGHGLLEMPTGTGKTVCLLSLITSYQYAHPDTGKLVYATRTVPEMNHVMQELAVVLGYRAQCLLEQSLESEEESAPAPASAPPAPETLSGGTTCTTGTSSEDPPVVPPPSSEETASSTGARKRPRRVYRGPSSSDLKAMGPSLVQGGAGGSGLLALCLSSRRNMCVHPRVLEESDREAIDAACRARTASWVLDAHKQGKSVETCEYYDNFMGLGEATSLPSGVYDLDALQKWGKRKGWCPYYLTRQAINHANVLVFNYQYMLDPKVRARLGKMNACITKRRTTRVRCIPDWDMSHLFGFFQHIHVRCERDAC